MIERIKKYKRWKDYFAVGCFEVNMAIGVTAILGVVLFKMFGIYEAFYNIQDDLKQILLSILGGEFTLLGMSLAGMAIITSVISTELIRIINLFDENETVNRVLSHFEFSAFNLAIQIAYILVIYFSLLSEDPVIGKYSFIVCFIIVCYHFFFNLFYIIALIGECIKINEIKNKCEKVASLEKTTIDIANEVRIDYILAVLLKDRGNKSHLMNALIEIIDKSNISDKQAIKDYLKKYYGW